MKVFKIEIDGVVMPNPDENGVVITHKKQWSGNKGRTTSGKLVGTCVAVKREISIKWSGLTKDGVELIKSVACNTVLSHTMKIYYTAKSTESFNVSLEDPTFTSYRISNTGKALFSSGALSGEEI